MKERQPDISVVMTVYNGEEFLQEAIESVLNQTYADFEFIIVVEKNCNQETLYLVQKYEKEDERICLIYNEERLGLAESLNVGIRNAHGRYIARMDDDDVSMPTRFEKQRKFMEENPEIGLCGCLQMTVKPDSERVLCCATEPEELKAEMLFGCQISHTSVMFRRQLFLQNNWFYKSNVLAEDFNLWIEVLDKIKMANLNEVLVKHRYGFNNISLEKGEKLHKENRELVKRALREYLQIDSGEWMDEVFCAWRNFSKEMDKEYAIRFLFQNLEFLQVLDENNRKIKFATTDVFVKVLFRRFLAVFNTVVKVLGIQEIRNAFLQYQPRGELNFRDNMLEFVNEICGIEYDTCIDAWKRMLWLPKESRIVIWGNGQAYKEFIARYGAELHKYCKVIGIGDNRMDEQERKEMISLLETDEFDYVLVSTGKYFYEIKEQLINYYGVSRKKIGLLSQLSFLVGDIDKTAFVSE